MFKELELPGTYAIHNFYENDKRGLFRKNYNAQYFNKFISKFKIRESYTTISKKSVVRGMHFQAPPFECSKLVTCLNGSIIQILLDIRKKSRSYGKFTTIKLKDTDNYSVFIPIGVSHGFISLVNSTTLLYQTSKEYSKENDNGIKWNSFGFTWPDEDNLIISERDENFKKFDVFKSPFD